MDAIETFSGALDALRTLDFPNAFAIVKAPTTVKGCGLAVTVRAEMVEAIMRR
jgi:hypothetical protein